MLKIVQNLDNSLNQAFFNSLLIEEPRVGAFLLFES